MRDMKYDCFISAILYLLNTWDRQELINPVLFLTYGFYYNADWKTQDDTIIYSYRKEDILEELYSYGIQFYLQKNSMVGLYSSSFTTDEANVLVVDGYECPWHQAYRTYHVDHHLILKKAFQNRIIVVDPFFSDKEYEFNDKLILRRFIVKNTEKREGTIIQKKINKDEYLSNLNSFCGNLFSISSQLLKYHTKIEEIQLLRDIKSILYSKYCLLEIMENQSEIASKCRELIIQWEILLSRLIYISLTKRIQQDNMNQISTNIKHKEIEIIHYL